MSDLYDYCNNPELWKKSGIRIKKRRKELKINSMDKFGEMISESSPIDRRLIGQIEAGKISINKTNTLAAFCRVLQCDPEYITCQCDTLRKENDDPLKRSGLLESSINILSDSMRIVAEEYDHLANAPVVPFNGSLADIEYLLPLDYENRAIKRMGKERFIKENNATAIVINFILGHYELIDTMFQYLKHTYGLNESAPGFNTDSYADILQYNPSNIGLYTVTPHRGRYVIEQEFIDKLRKAVSNEYSNYGPGHVPGTED